LVPNKKLGVLMDGSDSGFLILPYKNLKKGHFKKDDFYRVTLMRIHTLSLPLPPKERDVDYLLQTVRGEKSSSSFRAPPK
jgi:hypothetical protein